VGEKQPVDLRERVKGPPAPELVRAYQAPSLALELKEAFGHEMAVHLAHALMLARQGIIPAPDARQIVRAVLDLRQDGPPALAVDHTLEDVYSYVERHLVKRLGPEVGGRLHTGRSRNDLHATTWRMALRAKLLAVREGLLDLRRVLLELGDRHAGTVMPGYTHTQHAQPITFGYYCLAFADLLARDHARLAGAYDRCNRCPLGAGALTATSFPIDRDLTARWLGFDGLVEVAYDAVSARDDAAEATAVLALLMTNVSRLALDLQTWNTLEYGFVEIGDAFANVSSIMPQKKNPHALEHAKAAAAKVTGALTAVLGAMKNTSYADVSDGVTAINEPALDAASRTMLVLPLLTAVLRTLTFHPDRMRHLAAIGYGTATDLADAIVRETGLSFRMAHNIVGRTVARALAEGKAATDITLAMLDESCQALFDRPLGLSGETVAKALDPTHNVAARTVTGGPAPGEMARMLALRCAELEAEAAALLAARRRVEEAVAGLVTQAEAFAASSENV
jgi:argininosuccinate lyase